MGERRLRELAKALCDKLRLVHASEEYKGIWSFAHTHGLSYDGPTYTAELFLLEECLRGEAKEPEIPRPNEWPHVPLPKEPGRKKGKSKLVYDKITRTIKTESGEPTCLSISEDLPAKEPNVPEANYYRVEGMESGYATNWESPTAKPPTDTQEDGTYLFGPYCPLCRGVKKVCRCEEAKPPTDDWEEWCDRIETAIVTRNKIRETFREMPR